MKEHLIWWQSLPLNIQNEYLLFFIGNCGTYDEKNIEIFYIHHLTTKSCST